MRTKTIIAVALLLSIAGLVTSCDRSKTAGADAGAKVEAAAESLCSSCGEVKGSSGCAAKCKPKKAEKSCCKGGRCSHK